MKKISSKLTLVYKYVIPFLTFWFTISFIIWIYRDSNGNEKIYPILMIQSLMLVIFFVIFKKTVFNLTNEVFYNDGYLEFINCNKRIVILFSDINEIKYQAWTRPKRIVLKLNKSSEFGNELAFMPPINLNPLRRNVEIVDLIKDKMYE